MDVDTGAIRRINTAWRRHAPGFAWGDRLDARFIAAQRAGRWRGKRVLDIGCNAGVLLSELDASNTRVGLDRSAAALRIAQALNPGAGVIEGDMFRLPFQDGRFDAVLFCGMLEVPPHARKTEAVSELARVLRPGGELILTTPNRRYRRYRSMASCVTEEELRALLEPWFDLRVHGFNPVPPFPYGPPNRVLARVPGIWPLLASLMERGVGRSRACAWFVTAVRRPAVRGPRAASPEARQVSHV